MALHFVRATHPPAGSITGTKASVTQGNQKIQGTQREEITPHSPHAPHPGEQSTPACHSDPCSARPEWHTHSASSSKPSLPTDKDGRENNRRATRVPFITGSQHRNTDYSPRAQGHKAQKMRRDASKQFDAQAWSQPEQTPRSQLTRPRAR